MTKLPSRRRIVDAFKEGKLANDLAQRFGGLDRPTMKKAVALCASLHSAGEIDLFRLADEGELLALSDPLFFMATHFLDTILPELDEPPGRVMVFVDKLVRRGGSDGAANQPNAAFREWCKRDASRSSAVIEAAMAGDPLARQFLVFALEASMDAALAKQIALSESEAALPAIAALGRIPATDEEALDRAATLSQLLNPAPDDRMRAAVLDAATNLLRQDEKPGHDELLKVVALAANGGDVLTVHYAAQTLWLASDRLDDATADALLALLRHLKPENTGSLEFLDYGLAGLVKKGQAELAIGFVTDLVSATGAFRLKSFDDFMRTLAEDEDMLGEVAIRWLRNGSAALCDDFAGFLQRDNLRGQALKIPVAAIPNDPRVQTFVCRKALGYFFLLPTTAASVLVAILREAKGEAIEEVQSLIFNPLLTNYGGVADYLATIPIKDPVRKRTAVAQKLHTNYINGIRSVGTISELRPSEHHQRIHDRRIADEMTKAHKKAQKHSAFNGLMRHSVLLHGRGAVTFVRDGDQPLRAIEMDLQTLGVEMELPRAETLDPIGLSYRLSLFRAEKLKQ